MASLSRIQSNRARLQSLGKRLVWAGLDLVLPPRCGGCQVVGARWCPSCKASLSSLTPPGCQHCGYPGPEVEYCGKCRINRLSALRAVRSVAFLEGSLRNAVHRLKYRRDQPLAEALAEPMATLLAAQAWALTVVVPVPLAPRRLAERGYNQAALLGLQLAARARLPVDDQSLRRIRETHSQTQLNAEGRRRNVAGAFAVQRSTGFRGARVLLLDDVYTTGATLEACAVALLAAGVEGVWGLTLGRAR